MNAAIRRFGRGSICEPFWAFPSPCESYFNKIEPFWTFLNICEPYRTFLCESLQTSLNLSEQIENRSAPSRPEFNFDFLNFSYPSSLLSSRAEQADDAATLADAFWRWVSEAESALPNETHWTNSPRELIEPIEPIECASLWSIQANGPDPAITARVTHFQIF